MKKSNGEEATNEAPDPRAPIFNNKTRTKKSNYEGSLVGHYTTIGSKQTVAHQIPKIWT